MGISAYSQIALPGGDAVRAENVNPGDVLLNPLTGGALAVKKIWGGPGIGMFRIAAANGALVDLTGDQTLLAAGGPMPAERIRPGTVLVTLAGEAACTEASAIPGDYMVYDIVPEGGDKPCMAVNGFLLFLG